MTLEYLQEPRESSYWHIDNTMLTLQRQLENGTTSLEEFHAQMAGCSSFKKEPEATRYHAALVPPTAKPALLSEVQVSLARILAFERNLPDAIEAYKQVLEYTPNDETVAEELAYCLLQENRNEEALPYFDIALVEFAHFSDLWEGKGKALASLGRMDEALACFKQGLEVCTYEPYKSYLHYYIGLCYQNKEDNYRALAHYTNALELRPDFPEAYNNMGTLYFNADDDVYDVPAAIVHFKSAEAIAKKLENEHLLMTATTNLASLYKSIGEFDLHELYKGKMLSQLGFGMSDEDVEE